MGSLFGVGLVLVGYKWIDCVVGIDIFGGFMEIVEWYGFFVFCFSFFGVFFVEMDMFFM